MRRRSGLCYTSGMPKHKYYIDTTAPVAVKSGQADYHVPEERPWHAKPSKVSCPDCDVNYIVDEGFSHAALLKRLKGDHAKNQPHPPYIASDPAFTTITECKCK